MEVNVASVAAPHQYSTFEKSNNVRTQPSRRREASGGQPRRVALACAMVGAALLLTLLVRGGVGALAVASDGAVTRLEARDDDGDGAVSSFPVGSPFPGFSLTLLDNSTFTYDNTDVTVTPLLVVAVNADDPWIREDAGWMLLDGSSLRMFAEQAPSETTILFVGYGDDGAALVSRLADELLLLNISRSSDTLAFARTPLELASGSLAILLAQPLWRSARYGWAIGSASGARLDCKFEWCSPYFAEVDAVLVWGGDACSASYDASSFSSNVYALVTHAGGCTTTEAAERVLDATEAAGVVVIAQLGEVLEPVGVYDSAWYGADATMISARDGALILGLLAGQQNVTFNLTETLGPGYFVGADLDGNVYNLGYRYVQDLRFVTWEAIYLQYLSELEQAERVAGYVVPIFENAVLNDMTESPGAVVQLPSKALMRSFTHMYLELELTCLGDTDQSCAKWDHCITVWADCDGLESVRATVPPGGGGQHDDARRRLEVGGEPNELARYVTSFRRDVGTWRSDRTSLMPLLFANAGEGGTCNFSATVTSGTGWTVSSRLKFEGDSANAEELTAPDSILELVWPGDETDDSTLYERPFDSLASYNANQTVFFETPAAASKVELVSTISGHGDCEFEPTSHHYEVNNETYSIEFFEAGTMWGCAEQVRFGLEPNEHGTWNYGRDGWCDGSPVKMHVFDVTDAVHADETKLNQITYKAQSYGDDDARWTASLGNVYLTPTTLTDGCGGFMLVTSYLVFYAAV